MPFTSWYLTPLGVVASSNKCASLFGSLCRRGVFFSFRPWTLVELPWLLGRLPLVTELSEHTSSLFHRLRGFDAKRRENWPFNCLSLISSFGSFLTGDFRSAFGPLTVVFGPWMVDSSTTGKIGSISGGDKSGSSGNMGITGCETSIITDSISALISPFSISSFFWLFWSGIFATGAWRRERGFRFLSGSTGFTGFDAETGFSILRRFIVLFRGSAPLRFDITGRRDGGGAGGAGAGADFVISFFVNFRFWPVGCFFSGSGLGAGFSGSGFGVSY